MRLDSPNEIDQGIFHKLGLVSDVGNNSVQKYVVKWADGTFRWIFSIRAGQPGYLAFQPVSSFRARILRKLVILRGYLPKGSLLGFMVTELSVIPGGLLYLSVLKVKADDWDIFGGSPGVKRNLVVALLRNRVVVGYLKVRLYDSDIVLNDRRSDYFTNEFEAYQFISSLGLTKTLIPNVALVGEGIVMSSLNGQQLCLHKDSVLIGAVLKEILDKTAFKIRLGDYLDQKGIINRLDRIAVTQPKDHLFLKRELVVITDSLKKRISHLDYQSEIILGFSMIDFTIWNGFKVGEKVGLIDVEFCEKNVSLAYDFTHFIWQSKVMLGFENNAQQMRSLCEDVILPKIIEVFGISESKARMYLDLYLVQSSLRALESYVKQENLHKQGLLQIKLWLDLDGIWVGS